VAKRVQHRRRGLSRITPDQRIQALDHRRFQMGADVGPRVAVRVEARWLRFAAEAPP
jgi:hypothetical protein